MNSLEEIGREGWLGGDTPAVGEWGKVEGGLTRPSGGQVEPARVTHGGAMGGRRAGERRKGEQSSIMPA